MIPMADNCNHSDVTIVQEIINKQMHLVTEPGETYFTKTKMMNDYSINFEPSQYENDAIKTANVKGRYSKANFTANRQYSDVSKIKAALESGVPTWDVPCVRDTYTEDNDTEDEDEEPT